jgi:hypothetical protein
VAVSDTTSSQALMRTRSCCATQPTVTRADEVIGTRGVAQLGALTIASEVGDWRRFSTAHAFMGFTGLVPSEYSSGESVHRGHITKAGNAHLRTQLIESAWAYQHRGEPRTDPAPAPAAGHPGHRRPVLDRSTTPVRPV